MLAALPVVQEVIVNSGSGKLPKSGGRASVRRASRRAIGAKRSGPANFGISQSQPSLDDVYLAATGRTLMDAEMAAVGQRDVKKESKQSMR